MGKYSRLYSLFSADFLVFGGCPVKDGLKGVTPLLNVLRCHTPWMCMLGVLFCNHTYTHLLVVSCGVANAILFSFPLVFWGILETLSVVPSLVGHKTPLQNSSVVTELFVFAIRHILSACMLVSVV
jgi:hypothetical protein